MGNLLSRVIVLLLVSVSSMAQLPTVEDSLVLFSQGGRQWGFFKAPGWSATDKNSFVMQSQYGNGETSATIANFIKTPPGRQLNDAGTNWNGIVTLANGTVKRGLFILCPNYGDAAVAAYAGVMEYVIKELQAQGLDTSDHSRFIITGISGGGGRMEDVITNTGHSSPYSNLFERICFASSVSTRNFSTFKPYKCFVWVAGSEHDQTTPFANNISTYNSWKATKRLVMYSITQSQGAHSTNTWDRIFNMTSTTTNAETNMLRFMLSDGTDGITPIPVTYFQKFNN